jgi:hypothetical protein
MLSYFSLFSLFHFILFAHKKIVLSIFLRYLRWFFGIGRGFVGSRLIGSRSRSIRSRSRDIGSRSRDIGSRSVGSRSIGSRSIGVSSKGTGGQQDKG